jgi:hypothetical protein
LDFGPFEHVFQNFKNGNKYSTIGISAAVVLAHLSYLLDFGPFEHFLKWKSTPPKK